MATAVQWLIDSNTQTEKKQKIFLESQYSRFGFKDPNIKKSGI